VIRTGTQPSFSDYSIRAESFLVSAKFEVDHIQERELLIKVAIRC